MKPHQNRLLRSAALRRYLPPNRNELSTIVLGAGLFTGLLTSAQAADITMSGNDGSGNSSYASSGFWSNSAAPSGSNAYIVGNTRVLRGPFDGNVNISRLFAGDSLEIQSGGQFLLKFTPTAVATQTLSQNLILSGGLVNNGPNNTTFASVVKLAGTVTLTSSTTSTIHGNGNGGSILEVAAPISGSGNLTIGSAGNLGTITFTGTNTYIGATTISFGRLQIGNGGTTGSLSPSSVITNNSIFAINRSDAVVQGTDFSSAAITGSGSFIQAGSGTTTLSGTNTYTGATAVTAGKLLIGSTVGSTASLASTSTVTVSNVGTTLGGQGTVGGATTITNGNLAPGASAGSLEFGGSLTLAGAAQTQIELGGTAFTLNTTEEYDRIKLTGAAPTLTLTGVLNISLINSFSLLANQAFGILQLADGATRNGTFTGLATDGSLVGNYGGTDLFITYSANFGDSGAIAITGGNDIALYTIPEPAAALLGGLGTLLLLRRRRA